MGIYLNSTSAYALYKGETIKPYFVDKTQMLEQLFPLVDSGNNHICITRPRRFGKTVMANMIASFFSKGCDAQDIFENLAISRHEKYNQYRNQYSVIHISLNDISEECTSYKQYIERIRELLVSDLRREYPDARACGEGNVIDTLLDIYAGNPNARFIFVLDEWDFIFHQNFVTEEDKMAYLRFLRSLLKDRPYVLMAYMTGILPIAKYSSGSELNMFVEFTMAKSPAFADYFGFTEAEVTQLYGRYLQKSAEARVTMDGLRLWYNGYHTASGERVYNPRSVVLALSYSSLENYWTSAGPYDEIYYYIEHNVDEVRDDLARMISGAAVPAKIEEYAATSTNMQTREEIFSAMVVYGFLSYENGKVSIPNKELLEKFADMMQKEPSLGYVYQLAKESARMLQATLSGDTETMVQILELAHDTEVPLLSYNNEVELTAVVNLVYLSARDTYRIEREDKAGREYVDFIFYPERDRNADCIILELKVDHTPEEAIWQIKEKKYALKFKGKIGEPEKYTGRILAVGISYDKAEKKHQCKIEDLTDIKVS
ncbi:ATP-binding protein [Blautia schinkii]|nr:ATP-binding protein [Blautia schinkii]